jgi:hypothetical protein
LLEAKQEQKGDEDPEYPTEVSQFMASDVGREFLDGIRHFLKGQTITDVKFSPHDTGITTTLMLKEGEYFPFEDEELGLVRLREQFRAVFRQMLLTAKE